MEPGLIAVFLFFASIPLLIFYRIYTRHKEKMEMLSRGMNPTQFAPPPPPSRSGNVTLILGLLTIFLGVSFAVSAVLVQQHFDRDLMTGGVIIIFVGAAFLTFWKLTAPDRDRIRRIQEEHYTWLVNQAKHVSTSNTHNAPSEE